LPDRGGVTPILHIFLEKCLKWRNAVTCIYTDSVFCVTRSYTIPLNRVYQYHLGGVTHE